MVRTIRFFCSDIKMFGFGPVKATRPEGKLPKDPQVGIAIIEVLYYYIAKYPDRILVFVCSDESVWQPGSDNRNPRYAKWRRDIFSAWFEGWQQTGIMPAEKIDYNLFNKLYCSCMFRAGNPYEAEVRQVIDQTVLEKLI